MDNEFLVAIVICVIALCVLFVSVSDNNSKVAIAELEIGMEAVNRGYAKMETKDGKTVFVWKEEDVK